MVFTLPSNASQALYLENTITDFQMELPELILSHGTDYRIALASFTYPHTWYNVHDLANPSRLEWAWQCQPDSISVQLSCHQEPPHGDLQAQPEDFHRPVDDDACSPCLWAGQTGRHCCWAGKHNPHGSIPIKAGSGRELLCALQPSRQWSRDRQCQELPIAHCAC